MTRICTIYRSPKKEEMYLYVDRQEDLKRVPETLLTMFGTPRLVMAMLIKEDRDFARADAKKVLDEIRANGYYLQMPPPKEDYMLDLHKDTSDKYKD